MNIFDLHLQRLVSTRYRGPALVGEKGTRCNSLLTPRETTHVKDVLSNISGSEWKGPE